MGFNFSFGKVVCVVLPKPRLGHHHLCFSFYLSFFFFFLAPLSRTYFVYLARGKNVRSSCRANLPPIRKSSFENHRFTHKADKPQSNKFCHCCIVDPPFLIQGSTLTTLTFRHVYIRIRMHACVCVCVCVFL